MVAPPREGVAQVPLPLLKNNQKRDDQIEFSPRPNRILVDSKVPLSTLEQKKEVLCHDINAPAGFFDLAFFGDPKNDVANFFIIETRLGLQCRNIRAFSGALDDS